MSIMGRVALSIVACCLASACASIQVLSHVPASTISRLSALKLEDIQPSELRFASVLPDALEPRSQGARVTLDLGASGKSPPASYKFVLEPVDDLQEIASLRARTPEHSHLYTYRLARTDVDRLSQLKASAGGSGKGRATRIQAGIDACRHGPLPDRLPTTMFLRIDATGYFVLTENLDLRSLASAKQLTANVPPCN